MTDKKTLSTTYLKGEGRAHVLECMEATFRHCRDHDVKTLVIYTASGDGPLLAIERFLSQPQYSPIRVIAVTPSANRTYVEDPRKNERTLVQTGIFGDRRQQIERAGISIVSARLPFRSMLVGSEHKEPMQLVDLAFGVLGGGFSLCLQAAMMACDAGAIIRLERVAAMSADTAIVLVASQSESFFSNKTGLLVEHIICRPLLYDISKSEHFMTEWAKEQEQSSDDHVQLPLEGMSSDPAGLIEAEPGDAAPAGLVEADPGDSTPPGSDESGESDEDADS